MGRLTDDELAWAEQVLAWRTKGAVAVQARNAALAAFAKLRARRAADLSDEDLVALRWLRDKGDIATGRSVECDDPQCGDSTWDHDCNAGWEEIPEAKRAIAVLDKLLGKETDRA